MTNRILEISEAPARLGLELECLRVEGGTGTAHRIPLEELSLVVLSHPQIQVSGALLQSLATEGIGVLVCDAKRLPAGMMMPLQSHHLQSERMAAQTQASLPIRKRLWQQIVRQKIRAQSALLLRLHKDDGGIASLAPRVKSGDPDNLEAQAARRYWPLLFQDPSFRRDREAKDQNRHLNYGYAILRAQVARSICASGLHPALGLQHHNRYDPFPLADDLMEVYRPFVDEIVAGFDPSETQGESLTKAARTSLLSVLHTRVRVQGEDRSLSDAILHGAQSLAACLCGRQRRLNFPDPG